MVAKKLNFACTADRSSVPVFSHLVTIQVLDEELDHRK
jgi:hypothetical protein